MTLSSRKDAPWYDNQPKTAHLSFLIGDILPKRVVSLWEKSRSKNWEVVSSGHPSFRLIAKEEREGEGEEVFVVRCSRERDREGAVVYEEEREISFGGGTKSTN